MSNIPELIYATYPDLADKRVVITGGGTGIGAELVTAFVQQGAKVTFLDIATDASQELAASLSQGAKHAPKFIYTNLMDLDMLAKVFADIEADGPVEILVNNAGYGQQKLFVDLTVEDFDRMIGVHLRGTFLCTSAVLPEMLSRGRGVIVNVASQLGQIGGVELCHYSAAKAGIIGLTKSLAREVSAQGVRVNAVAPGPINTDLVLGLSEEWRRNKAAELPLGRFGEPWEVAETVAFLASEGAALYVGQTLGPNSGDVML